MYVRVVHKYSPTCKPHAPILTPCPAEVPPQVGCSAWPPSMPRRSQPAQLQCPASWRSLQLPMLRGTQCIGEVLGWGRSAAGFRHTIGMKRMPCALCARIAQLWHVKRPRVLGK